MTRLIYAICILGFLLLIGGAVWSVILLYIDGGEYSSKYRLHQDR